MPLSRAQAKHLCRRVGFGGKPAEITLFEGMERADAVEYVLDAQPTAPSEPPGVDNPEWWEPLPAIKNWWVQRMIDGRWNARSASTPSPLEEKMTLFWHSHFASGLRKVEQMRAMFDQQKIFRNRGMGSFHTLLERVCTNGALLQFLDNPLNTAEDLQENFARELMELYTIGPDEFTESDVIEMAKAWTGHGIVGWVGYMDATYRYHPEEHDNSQKVLFGLPAQRWNGPDTLEIFTSGVKRDATARFISRKLWQFFVNDDPTESELQDVVDAFLPNLVIRNALRAIFNHDSFWALDNRFALTRSPMEFVVDVMRKLNVRSEDTGLHYQMDELGQELFEPPSVAGWGTGSYWVSTMSSWSRAAFLVSLGWEEQVRSQFEILREQPDADTAVDELIDIMGIPSASPATRAQIATWWTAHRTNNQWAMGPRGVVIGGMAPEMHVA